MHGKFVNPFQSARVFLVTLLLSQITGAAFAATNYNTGTDGAVPVMTVLNNNCATAGCHNGTTNPNLSTYANATAGNTEDRIIVRATELDTMPPGGALAQNLQNILIAWQTNGFAENNRAPDGTINTPAADQMIAAGDSVNFSGSGNDAAADNPADTPLAFLWSFGAGSGVPDNSNQNPGNVTFNNEGSFSVSLTVSDSEGLADPTPATVNITVGAANQPPAGIIDTPVDANTSITVGDSVTFTASASDPDANLPLTHLWTFGAGSGIADSNAEDPGAVAFNATGTFQVTYTVTDNLGLADPTPDTRTIEVNPVQPPDGVIDAPANAVTQITVGESVNFTATASDPDGDLPLSHAWTFGAGSGVADSTAEDPGDIVFNIPGLFTVSYTVTDAKGVSDATPDTRIIAVSAATPAVRQLSFDLKAGELMQRAGAAEDAFRSGVAGFEPVMLTPAANTLRLEIGFTSDTALQTIFLAAFGTGSPRPETFASRLPGDCADGLNGCTHNFGPGMTLSNSTGALGDGSTSLVMTVTLTETNGVFAADFVNPYSEGPGACSDAPVDECSIGAHFPDLVDGDDIASFRGLVIDITFSTAVPVTVDGFEFNLLGGGIQIAETPLPEGWDLTVTEVMLSALELPANGNLVVTATVSNIGDQASPAQVRIRVFRSADAIINLSDIIIDDDTLENPILPGESFTQAANVKVPGAGGAGSWWIGVCIITAAGETDATNNCSDGTMILVVRPNGIFSDQFEN